MDKKRLALEQTTSGDISDDTAPACIIAARIDLIVTGDKDLLACKAYRDIPMITPAEALRMINVPL